MEDNSFHDIEHDVEKEGALVQISLTSDFFFKFSLVGSLVIISLLLISAIELLTTFLVLVLMMFISVSALLFEKYKTTKISILLSALLLIFTCCILFVTSLGLLITIIRSKDIISVILSITSAVNVLFLFVLIALLVSSIKSLKGCLNLRRLNEKKLFDFSSKSDLPLGKFNKKWIIVGLQIVAIGILVPLQTLPSLPLIKPKSVRVGKIESWNKCINEYWQAVRKDDKITLSTIAMEPIWLEVESWQIVSASNEKIEFALLQELSKTELELKKKVVEHIEVAEEARDALDKAVFERNEARTRTSKIEAQKKVDELQAKWDEIFKNHKKMQEAYDIAIVNSYKEESITCFSLGVGDLQNIRDFAGYIHSKEVDIKLETKSGMKNYRCYLRKYELRDESLNMTQRGGWIIVKFEPFN